ncbi:hypothetical protein ACRRTK_020435 [Alexandromys fortis]
MSVPKMDHWVYHPLGFSDTLKQEDGGRKEDEKVSGVDQLSAPASYENGKYVLGYKQTLKMIRQGKVKLVILTNNYPTLRKYEIEYYAMLAKTGVHHYSGNNIELGTACGKYYKVCTLAIIDSDQKHPVTTDSSDKAA